MDVAGRFTRNTSGLPKIELPIQNLALSHVELDGNGKRRYLRFWHANGGCQTIDLMGGGVEVFSSGAVEFRSASLDDLDWTTQYGGAEFRVTKAEVWVYNGESQAVIEAFEAGVCRPIGDHHHSLWANACVGAEWVRIWLCAGVNKSAV